MNSSSLCVGARVKVRFFHLHPTNLVRNILGDNRSLSKTSYCFGLRIASISPGFQGVSSLFSADLCIEPDTSASLFANLSHCELDEDILSESPPIPSQASPLIDDHEADLQSDDLQDQNIDHNLGNDGVIEESHSADVGQDSTVPSNISSYKKKLSLKVGDSINCKARFLLPRSHAVQTYGSLFSTAVIESATITSFTQYKSSARSKLIPSVNVTTSHGNFTLPISHVAKKNSSISVHETQQSTSSMTQPSQNLSQEPLFELVNETGNGIDYLSDGTDDEETGRQENQENEFDFNRFSNPSTEQVVWNASFTDPVTVETFPHLYDRQSYLRRRLDVDGIITPAQIFKMFFPMKFLEANIVPATNDNGRKLYNTWLPTSAKELLEYIAVNMLMGCHLHSDKSEFWGEATDDDSELQIRVDKYMKKSRYEQLSSAIAVTKSSDIRDSFGMVRPLIAAFNLNMKDQFCSGFLNCIDESMMSWENPNSCAGWMAVLRKPMPLGNEYHTLGDVETKIIYYIEVVEGKDSFGIQPFFDQKNTESGGKVISLLLRMTHGAGLHSTGKAIILDSGFGVLKALCNLYAYGIVGMACIKKKAYWPRFIDGSIMKEKLAQSQIGDTLVRKGTFKNLKPYTYDATHNRIQCNVPFYHIAYKDQHHVGQLMSTFSNSLTSPDGNVQYRKNGTQLVKFRRPKTFDLYYQCRNAVDVNNQIRQGNLCLEQQVGARLWPSRTLWFIISLAETNAFLAYNYFNKDKPGFVLLTKLSFRRHCCKELLTPTTDGNSSNETANRVHKLIKNPKKSRVIKNGKYYFETARLRCTYCEEASTTLRGHKRTQFVCICKPSSGVCIDHFEVHANVFEQ
jgi:hypothetical protein